VRSATSWPIALVGCPEVEAYRSPEAPADDITDAAPSPPSGEVWLRYAVSYSSVIPDGGRSDLLCVIAKKPTTTSPDLSANTCV
jgi:hypothetical protein